MCSKESENILSWIGTAAMFDCEHIQDFFIFYKELPPSHRIALIIFSFYQKLLSFIYGYLSLTT